MSHWWFAYLIRSERSRSVLCLSIAPSVRHHSERPAGLRKVCGSEMTSLKWLQERHGFVCLFHLASGLRVTLTQAFMGNYFLAQWITPWEVSALRRKEKAQQFYTRSVQNKSAWDILQNSHCVTYMKISVKHYSYRQLILKNLFYFLIALGTSGAVCRSPTKFQVSLMLAWFIHSFFLQEYVKNVLFYQVSILQKIVLMRVRWSLNYFKPQRKRKNAVGYRFVPFEVWR